ncbi:hypothetical protein [Prosthecobacter sp.]|uniref:hypothetical protein n=1 Tax=Prosthecobacter sp. TaxID=1965333 RepID=UPI001DCB4CFC|nr:hypothetical protein [Prosthecobacter sp.]MCB1279405.1 hypothetical protein [Prosthecobacter sp.]
MKTSILKTITARFLAIGALALVSCQGPASVPTSAATCSKCHTIWFKAPVTGGVGAAGEKGGIVALRSASTMSCPDCKNKVVEMLKGGNITHHTCSSCGGALHHCTQH